MRPSGLSTAHGPGLLRKPCGGTTARRAATRTCARQARAHWWRRCSGHEERWHTGVGDEMASVGKHFALSGRVRDPPGRRGTYTPAQGTRGRVTEQTPEESYHGTRPMRTLRGADSMRAEDAPSGR